MTSAASRSWDASQRTPIIACCWKPSLSGSVTPTIWRMPRAMRRLVHACTVASETPRAVAICVKGRRPSSWRCSMIRLSSSEISLDGPRTSPGRTRKWACCDIGGRAPNPCDPEYGTSDRSTSPAARMPSRARGPPVPRGRTPTPRSSVSNVGLVLGLIAVGVVDGVLIAVLAAQLLLRPFRGASRPRPAVASLAPIDHRTLTALDGDARVADGVPIAAYDRVVLIVGWAWFLSTVVVVSASGLWTDRQGAILAILAIAVLFVLVAHDLLPAGVLGRAKYLVEGCVSIVFVTLIVLLTGGAPSPFFFAFVLIVVGAALVVPPAAAVALAVLAAASYVIAIAVDLAPGGLDVAAIAVVGVNLVSLILLAYVAMVVAREQRRTRQVAVRLSP